MTIVDAGIANGESEADAAAAGPGDTSTTVDTPPLDDPDLPPAGADDTSTPAPQLPPFEPAPATLHRLTAAQHRATVMDLLGVDITTPLEADTSLHGFVSIAASELTIPPLAQEQYEAAAWEAADALFADGAKREALVGCDPSDALCLRAFLLRFGRQAWRRPLDLPEVEQLEAVAAEVVGHLGGDPWRAVQGSIALFLQSPHFLFRVEHGETDPDHPGWRRYTDSEMAARVSYFLWGTTPDDELLDAAAAGMLTDDDGLTEQALRLLGDERARTALTAFFDEFLGLDKLASVTKDADAYPMVDDALKASARRELALLFDEVAFVEDGDFRWLLSTDITYVDDPLAALYGLEPVGPEVTRTALPALDERGGLAGRVAILMTYSHALVNSPTLRGRFVRERLLCQDVPPPPPGVVTELESSDDGEPQTLKDKLEAHRKDPACAPCHELMDPIGFALEHFGPVGERRELDNGLPIDDATTVDGVDVEGGAELGQRLAEHPMFPRCVSARLYRHAVGHLESYEEVGLLDELWAAFVADEHRFQALVLEVVLSDGFRLVSAPASDPCELGEIGDSRACDTACGAGSETCTNRGWAGCDAPWPTQELCNGVDDDCDGEVDEGVLQACAGPCQPGVQTCTASAWGACEEASPPPELCNGIDDDCDGLADEGLEVVQHTLPYADLQAEHGGCDGVFMLQGDACNAAINRWCGKDDCAQTGFGPVGLPGGPADIVCLAASEVVVHQVPYAELSTHHPPCDGTGQHIGPDCSAAMKRWCNSIGQVSGFGPLEHGGGAAAVACTPAGQFFNATYTVLQQYHATCSAGGERWGPACNMAIHAFCQDQGFASGYGPVENYADDAHVTCVGGPTP